MTGRRRLDSLKTCTTLAFLLVVPTALPAADWQSVAESDVKQVFFNAETLRRAGDLVTVWAKENYSTPQPAAKKNRTYLSARVEYRLDCARRMVATASIKVYPETELGGEVVQKASWSDKNLQWLDAPPGTVLDSMLNYACRR
jgi:hypothetical protein